jgi:menaquinone-dependent protoporphyrinogen oxidase
MKPVAVLYSAREGQTCHVAQYVVSRLRALGFDAELRIVTKCADAIDLSRYGGAVLAASVHRGRHESEMVRFAGTRLADLQRVPTAFLSVSLSQAGVERAQTPERRRQFAADVESMIARFEKETGWHPRVVQPVAGALAYRKYNPLVRFIVKQITRKAVGQTDTSRNYEFTNWAMLDRCIDEWVVEVWRDEVTAGAHAA